MTDAPNGWPDPTRPGVPLNPERRGAHWLRRKSGGLEAWSWDPDADGCGTEYSGAWQEADGDGQPDDMARWMLYEGPCLTPAEHAAALAEAKRAGMRKAAGIAKAWEEACGEAASEVQPAREAVAWGQRVRDAREIAAAILAAAQDATNDAT